MRRRQATLPLVAWAGLPLVGVLGYVAPIAAAVLTTAATGLIAVLVLNPLVVLGVVAVLITAVPKAGITFGAFPLPVMLLVLVGILPLLRRAARTRGSSEVTSLAILALAWMAVRMVVMVLDGGTVTDLLALAGWYGLPLLLLVGGPVFGSLRGEAGRRWVRNMELGILIACAFGFLQWAFGVTRFALPGITQAFGADLTEKPIFFAGGSKIPSTYQNGNVLGVATAFFFLIAAERLLTGRGSRRDRVLLVATAVATILSGSRTAVLGLVLGLIVLVLRSRPSHRTIGVCLGAGLAFLAVLQFSPALSDRLLGTTAKDPNVTFRTDSWSTVIHSASLTELATGGSTWVEAFPDPGQVEGFVGAVQQVGLIGMALFLGVFVVATRQPGLRRWRLLLIPVAFSLGVDSAYLVFPTLFIPVVRMFAPLTGATDDEDAPEPERDTVTVPQS